MKWLASQASLDGADTVWHTTGKVYAFIPGKRPVLLFGIEGVNLRRLLATPEKDGCFLAQREVFYYTDPASGAVLDRWKNPFTEREDEVMPVTNDPVNLRFRVRNGRCVMCQDLHGRRELGEIPEPKLWDGFYIWSLDVFPFYPVEGLPKPYTAAELFEYRVPASGSTTFSHTSWCRIGPWLPWMGMTDHEGLLVYHAQSRRLKGFEQLPTGIKERIRRNHPAYQRAPEVVDPSVPNATSWSTWRESRNPHRVDAPAARPKNY